MATGRYHWSHAAREARFFFIHSSACVPVLALILHPSWKGLYVSLAMIALLVWIEKVKKMSLRAFSRSMNLWVTGRVKSSLNLFKELTR